jgi:glutamate racemase
MGMTISGVAGESLLKELAELKAAKAAAPTRAQNRASNAPGSEPFWAVQGANSTTEKAAGEGRAQHTKKISVTLSAGSGRHLARELKRACAHHKRSFNNSTCGLLAKVWEAEDLEALEALEALGAATPKAAACNNINDPHGSAPGCSSIFEAGFFENNVTTSEEEDEEEAGTSEEEEAEEEIMLELALPGLSWNWEIEDQKFAAGQRCSTIGMFDSGVGGLTVYMELKRRFPNVHVVYFADMERQPYGPRQQTEVGEFCDEILHFMKRQGAGIGVIACNTATAATFDNEVNEREKFDDFPIFGTIPFAARAAMAHGKRVGVIATQGTCTSGAYSRACGADASCVQMPCPEFMELAEAGAVDEVHTKDVAMEYMQPCKAGNFDSLIYGCTHYPILSAVVEEVLFKEFGLEHSNIQIVDPAVSLVDKMLDMMEPCLGEPTTRFCVNKDTAGFAERASRILGYDVSAQCELVDLQR